MIKKKKHSGELTEDHGGNHIKVDDLLAFKGIIFDNSQNHELIKRHL